MVGVVVVGVVVVGAAVVGVVVVVGGGGGGGTPGSDGARKALLATFQWVASHDPAGGLVLK